MKKTIIVFILFLMILALMPGCSSNAELDELKKRVDKLEVQLEEMQEENTPVTEFSSPEPEISASPISTPDEYQVFPFETLHVTEDIYDRIELGATYDQVCLVIGDIGILESRLQNVEVVKWQTSSLYYIYCRFEDGVLVEKWADEYAWKNW
jgi:hypothetical protein